MKYFSLPLLACVCATGMKADFTYNSTSQMTGGSLLKMMSVFAGKMKDPVPSTVAVKGNRMAHKTGNATQIVDLDKETITRVNFDRKTYSVVTFAQMKEALQNMTDKATSKSGDVQTDIKVSVNETGQKKNIAGFDAKEAIMKIEMAATSTKDQGSGSMTITSDMWIAPEVPGYGEMRDFYKRMSEKLDWAPGGSPLMARPDIAKGMSAIYKQTAAMNGLPVQQVMKMGGQMTGGQTAGDPDSGATSGHGATTPSDAIASALGGRFGLGRKKNSSAANGNSDAQSTGGTDALIEMTTQVNSVSDGTADPALFEVPGGFKEVKEDVMPKGRGR